MVGEVNDTDATVTSYWAGGQTGFDGIDTHLTTPFDFPMFQAIGDVVARGESAKKIVTVLRQDRFYPHPELLVTLLDNHDRPRFITQANGSAEKLKLGLSLLLTLRGIPQLYSGDEIGIPGGEDPDNRRDFPGGFPGDSNNAFTQSSRTPEQQDVFAHTQTLLKLRHDHPALRTGTLKHVAVADKYYAFTRETGGERLLIVFHNAGAQEKFSFDLSGTSIADAKTLTSIFGPSGAQLQNGHVDLQLAPYSLTVYQVH
jgi:glycosidase